MISILTGVLLVTWLLASAGKSQRNVHMLQQNSYRNERYIRWMKGQKGKAFPARDYVLLLGVILSLFGWHTVAIVALSVLFLLFFLAKPKSIEKLKLAYTSRVKRLFTTIAILHVIAGGVAFWFAFSDKILLAILIVVLVYMLNFFIVIAANMINKPLETSINHHYFNDAKRILQSSNNLKVIGITGSYGKTSTKHILHSVLASHFNVLMTPESYNTKLGVTITVRRDLKPYHDIFIAEMGAKQKGDIQEICDLVEQKYGVLTSIGEQHLETFKTLDTIKRTKFELIDSLPQDGIAFLNKDDENIMATHTDNSCRKVYYGIDADGLDYKATDITYHSRGSSFTLVMGNGEQVEFSTKLLGKHNIYNILSAIAVGVEFGVPMSKIVKAVRQLNAVSHRLEIRRTNSNLTIIDDSFNSNPVGSKMAVDVLGYMDEYKVLITPGMVELGEKQYELNKAFAEHAATVCDYIVLVGEKQTIPLQDGLKAVGYPESQYKVVKNLQEALVIMHELSARQKTVVLLENDLPDLFNE